MEKDPDRPDTVGAEWDERYRAKPHLFRQEPDETLVELVAPLPPGTALDLGAGEGRNTLWLARRSWEVVGVDASAVALERLSSAATEEDLSVETARDDALGFLSKAADRRRSFDLVVVAYFHPPSDDRARLLRAAGERVAPGGHLFVVAHHRDSLGRAGPPDPDRLYVEADLEPLADEGLGILRLQRRSGVSDVTDPGVDIVFWAERRA
jgi:SAM-dependent methyltransferase